jgi:Secretion system C-terminal sorting domain
MKKYFFLISFILVANASFSQNVGIVRKNYISSYFDSTLMMVIDVFDSATVRLGSIDPINGIVTNIGSIEYNSPINLNGATIDPYLNRYYIGSGFNFLTFDINSGDVINNVPIYGALPSAAFQNFRFNTSDSIIYGMVPNNFYSTYFDSTIMMNIDVLDSTQIRFASLNPTTGEYTFIGNSSFSNLYTLAGNSIDPYQMLYYYSAVDTLIGIDLYTGAKYSEVPIQVPLNGIFENIAYSCVDTTIYGITRQNYISSVFDSLLMEYVENVDSTTFKFSKIDPNSGVVTFISPINIGAGGNLTGGAFIDPNTMTYYFSNGNQIVGVSMITGLITSAVTKSFSSGAIAFDMMRSTGNCFGATKIRLNTTTGINENADGVLNALLFPNPASNLINLQSNAPINKVEILDFKGSLIWESKLKLIDVSSLASGIYFARMITEKGNVIYKKFVKN